MVAQLGLIAGGLSDGTIGIWNPDAIIKAQQGAEDVPDALVATLAGHEGAVRLPLHSWPCFHGAHHVLARCFLKQPKFFSTCCRFAAWIGTQTARISWHQAAQTASAWFGTLRTCQSLPTSKW